MHLKSRSLAFLASILTLGTTIAAPQIRIESRRDANPVDPWATLTNGESPAARDATIFGNVALGTFREERFRMTNTGDQTLIIASTSRVGGSQFQFVSLVTSLAPGARDEFRVRYTPTEFGGVTPFVRINSNDPSDAQFNYALSATGTGSNMSVRGGTGFGNTINDGDTTPTTADNTDFGASINADGSDTITRTFQTRNIGGTDTLNLGNGSISPAGSPFSISSVNNVSNGGSDNFTITFSPDTAGTFNATVNITTDDQRAGRDVYSFAIRAVATGTPNIQVDGRGNGSFDEIPDGGTGTENFNATDFGDVDINTPDTRRYRIENEGNDTLTVSSITSSNPEFSVTSSISSIAGGGNLREEFTITFTPQNAGRRTSTITINSNDPDQENPYTYRVAGTGSGPVIEVYGGENLDQQIFDGQAIPSAENQTLFDPVPVNGGANSRTFVIRNTGNKALNIRNASNGTGFVGPQSGSFDFAELATNGIVPEIAPGEEDEFRIIFDPEVVGNNNAAFNIVTNTSGDTQTFSFGVSGIGTDPASTAEIVVFGLDGRSIESGDASPRSQDGTAFGETGSGQPAIVRTFQIRNNSPQEVLTIRSGIELTGSGFTVTSSPPSTVGINGTANFSIRLDSDSAPGNKRATVRIITNDADTPSYTFAISGVVTGSSTAGDPKIGVEQEGDDLVFTIDPAGEATYRITTSTDLKNWTALPGQTGLKEGSIRLSDVIGQGGGSARYYRLEEE